MVLAERLVGFLEAVQIIDGVVVEADDDVAALDAADLGCALRTLEIDHDAFLIAGKFTHVGIREDQFTDDKTRVLGVEAFSGIGALRLFAERDLDILGRLILLAKHGDRHRLSRLVAEHAAFEDLREVRCLRRRAPAACR